MSAKVIHFPVRPTRLALRLEWFATDKSVLLGIWALYFALRAAVLLIDVAPTGIGEWYYLRAASLAAGHGYLGDTGQPTALVPAGWPIALSLVFAQFGTSPVALGLFNLVSSMLVGVVTLALGRRLFGSEGAARAGLLLLAVYPNAIGYVPLALPEVFYTALLLTASWVVVTRTNRWHLVSAGVLLGIATLIRPQTLVLVPLIFAVDWLRMGPAWKRLPRLAGDALLVLAIAALTVMPWTLRNYAQLGHWVPVSTSGGQALLAATPAAKEPAARPAPNEARRDAEAQARAVAWITAHPGPFLALAPDKLAKLWLNDGEADAAYAAGAPGYPRFEPVYRAVRMVNQGYYAALMLAFAAAFVVMIARRRRDGQRWTGWWLLPYAAALHPTLVCAVFAGATRLHYPVMPWICMTAGWLAMATLGRLGERHAFRPTLH